MDAARFVGSVVIRSFIEASLKSDEPEGKATPWPSSALPTGEYGRVEGEAPCQPIRNASLAGRRRPTMSRRNHGGPLDEGHLVLEPASFRRLQTRVSKNILGRLAEPTLAENGQTAGQVHPLGSRQIKDVIANREKQAVNVSSSRDRQCAVPTSDRRARLV